MRLLRNPRDYPRAPPCPGGVVLAGIGDIGEPPRPRPASNQRPSVATETTDHADVLALVRLGGQVQRAVRSATSTEDLMRRVNRLLAGRGVRVTGLRLAPRSVVTRFAAGRLPHVEARRATKEWRRLDARTAEVWLRRGRRTLGSLLVDVADLTPARRAAVEVVAEGVVAAIHDVLLSGARETAAEWKAHAEAQRRITALASASHEDKVRSIRAGVVEWEAEYGRDAAVPVDDLLEALDVLELRVQWGSVAADLLPVGPRALPSSLRRLTAWLDERVEVAVTMEVRGRPRALAPAVARALYTVAYECLTVVQDLRGCRRARVVLEFQPEEIMLVIRDDGAGQRPRERLAHALGALLGRVGGTLDVRSRSRGGVIVTTTVPHPLPTVYSSGASSSRRLPR
jgi:hypothetical protein